MNTTLITVLGSSPQVMTETLYALKDKNFPTRIIVFTTQHGAAEIKRLKVDEKIKSLCTTYKLNVPTLLEADIKIVKDLAGNELSDIRNQSDQEAMADQITHTVRKLVNDKETAIHASIAGGRKSMSFYMGYIFSIFARPCDTLSHVLVLPEFESNNFWYPTPSSHKFVACINRETGEECYLDAKDGEVELAEIPFLRINNALASQGDLLTQNASYRETLSAYQLALSPENITLEFTDDYRVLLNDKQLDLSIETIAFYHIIAHSTLNKLIYQKNITKIADLEVSLLAELARVAKFNLNGEKPIDMIDELFETLKDDTDYNPNTKLFNTIENKGLTQVIIERMQGDITKALKKVAIGCVITLCEVTIVKDKLDESKPEARSKTKGGYLGLQLNPKQIKFS